MEENVALDSQKQKKFVKSIRGIKKLIQKTKEKDETEGNNDGEAQESTEPFSMRLKNDKNKKNRRKPRGLVYLSHIPHGFYEHQMTQYFKQFGGVTNARVIRSKRTGNSKGYAFVEFKEPSVAEIVAETMNNYLMGKRLIKAAYIPPEKQRRAFRKRWNSMQNPTSERRLKNKKAYNADLDEKGNLKKARKLLSKTKKRLSEMGINYDFFTPVDVPEELLGQIVKQEKPDNVVTKKKEKNQQKTENSTKEKSKVVDTNKAKKDLNKKGKIIEKQAPVNVNKKGKEPVNVNKQEQNQKKKTLKDAGGVKTLEEFIKLDDGSGDSDSSAAFDSDEYEKALEHDESDMSSGDSDDADDSDEAGSDDDENDDEEEDSEVEEEPPRQLKAKAPVPKATAAQSRRQGNKQQQPQEVKRKAPQRPGGSPKKPKFEKQNQKPMKKQFKRK